jgi:hypothetical protein
MDRMVSLFAPSALEFDFSDALEGQPAEVEPPWPSGCHGHAFSDALLPLHLMGGMDVTMGMEKTMAEACHAPSKLCEIRKRKKFGK